MGWGDDLYKDLIGKKITEIHMDDDNLAFITADGDWVGYEVYGDCCSWSYFHDFFGVQKLLDNGPVKEFTYVDLEDEEVYKGDLNAGRDHDECLQVYGYKLVTEHPLWGEQTSVFSFRNESNGYYGGDMIRTDRIPVTFFDGDNKLTEDKT